MDLFWTNKIPNQNFWHPLAINPDQTILTWDRYGFILDQYGLCWIRDLWLGIGMDLFWTTMDYVGSDSSGLGSVWSYSGPIKSQTRISGSPLMIKPNQAILAWDQHGFILDQYGLR